MQSNKVGIRSLAILCGTLAAGACVFGAVQCQRSEDARRTEAAKARAAAAAECAKATGKPFRCAFLGR